MNEDGLEFELGEKSETLITKTRALENIKYEVSVVTGNEKGAGTGKTKEKKQILFLYRLFIYLFFRLKNRFKCNNYFIW